MRIAVNAHLLPAGPTYRSAGVASYVKQLVDRLPQVAPQHEYVFFAPPGRSGPGVVPARLPTSNPVVRIAWEQVVEPGAIRRCGADAVHSPVNVSPLLPGCPTVVTLHDLAFLKFPHTFTRAKRIYLSRLVGISARHADHVIVPSDASRLDVVEALGVAPDKVTVVPEGVDERYRVRADVARPLQGPYILFAGTIEPRKNLPVLLRSFASLKVLGYPHKLALAGAPGWMYEEVYRTIESLGIADSVALTGFVGDLVPWYNHADLFVYPSLYEGFGLPPLEAMACGTPAVTSSAGSLREVIGNAGILVAPTDVDGFVEAMRSILDDAELRQRLIRAGAARAAMFSWDDTVRKTVGIYEAVYETRRNRMMAA